MATLEERVQALEKLLSVAAGTEPYSSLYTGPQIDEAVSRALPGGAIDIASQNKAENKKISTSLSSAGWYRAAFMRGSANGDATSYIVSISEDYMNYTPHSTVFMLSIGAVGATTIRASLTRIGNPTEIGGGYSVDKVRFVAGANVIGGYLDIHYNRSGTSGVGVSIVPLDHLYFLNMLDFASVPDTVSEYAVYGYADEWVNPPMTIGEEYRTTERFNGKPVYCLLKNWGGMPNASRKEVTNALSGRNAETVLSCEGYPINRTTGTYYYKTPMFEFDKSVSTSAYPYSHYAVRVSSSGSGYIMSYNDMTAFDIYVLSKYTKTTD